MRLARWLWLGVVAIASVFLLARGQAEAASWAVADLRTGAVLSGDQVDRPEPAGATYQLLVVLSALEQAKLGMLPLDAPVSVDAQTIEEFGRKPGELLKLAAGRPYVLGDLLKAVLLARSDLAAVAAAEAMWGSRDNAVEALNERTRRLGLTVTRWSVLSSDAADNVTSAREVSRLVACLWREHEEVRQWGTLRGFPFDQGRIVLANNHLPPSDVGVWAFYDRFRDVRGKRKSYQRLGVLVSEREGMALGVVQLGVEELANGVPRMVELMRSALAEYEPVTIVREGESLNVRVLVDGGLESSIVPTAARDLKIVRRKGSEPRFQMLFQVPSVVTAPIAKGEQLGEIVVQFEDNVIGVVPAVSPKSVSSQGVRSAGTLRAR
ncbi:MAG: serine-type D-Ala-D-Ala carboxypeptidase [Candidatus Binatia bacterium]|nr:MAG: serine-type D-Ala-D-Ala carboxypeptidase [Candidatus Binatia bacterium]